MATRNISLTEELDEAVERRVKSGRYANASEVMRAALRALELHEKDDAIKMRLLRKAIQDGLDSGVADNYSLERVYEKAGILPSK